MDDASMSQTTTDPLDELTSWVRDALQFVWRGRSLEDLECYNEIPRGELESVLAGTQVVSPLTALWISNALGCWAEDIHDYWEKNINEVFADLPPSVQKQAMDKNWGKGWRTSP
jgi:hypothetical protein